MRDSSTMTQIVWTFLAMMIAFVPAGAEGPRRDATRAMEGDTPVVLSSGAQSEASLRVEATPGEAEVYVDGYYVGRADQFDSAVHRLRVTPGAHRIALYLPGYWTLTRRIALRPNGTYTLRDTMERLPAGETSQLPPTPLVPLPGALPPR